MNVDDRVAEPPGFMMPVTAMPNQVLLSLPLSRNGSEQISHGKRLNRNCEMPQSGIQPICSLESIVLPLYDSGSGVSLLTRSFMRSFKSKGNLKYLIQL